MTTEHSEDTRFQKRIRCAFQNTGSRYAARPAPRTPQLGSTASGLVRYSQSQGSVKGHGSASCVRSVLPRGVGDPVLVVLTELLVRQRVRAFDPGLVEEEQSKEDEEERATVSHCHVVASENK